MAVAPTMGVVQIALLGDLRSRATVAGPCWSIAFATARGHHLSPSRLEPAS